MSCPLDSPLWLCLSSVSAFPSIGIIEHDLKSGNLLERKMFTLKLGGREVIMKHI